jgi:DamX protein
VSESVTPTSEPAYITKLALSAAPFNNKVEAGLYYGGGQAGHRLNLLLHLVRASDKVANLVAKQGYGKSTLLNQLQQRTGDEIRLCVVDAQQHVDITAILGQCLVSLGVSSDEILSTDAPLTVFKTRLVQLQRLSITPVILIDNAALLSESLIGEISVWLGWQESARFLLQAIIASATPLLLLDYAQSRLQIVTLPALSEMELPAYLLHRLNCVAYRGESPFLDKDIKRIYQQSLGCPAVVNQLAHQQLLGIKPMKATSDILANPIVLLLRRWAGLAVVVLALMSLLIFQDTVNSWLTAATDKPEIDETTVIIEAEEVLPTVVTAEQAERDELADLIADIPSSDHVNELQGLEPTHKPVAGPIQKQNQPAAVVVVPQVQAAPIFLKQDWVLQQTTSHYTFQLMGSWDREEVYDFIEQYALVGNVAVFESMRNGRIWHVLIYGSFEDKNAALKASNGWPAPLNTLPSWLRRFDNVQQQIKNKAVIE